MRRSKTSARGFQLLWDATVEQARMNYRDGVRDGMLIALRMVRGEEQYGVRGYPKPLEHTEGFTLWVDEVINRLEEDGAATGEAAHDARRGEGGQEARG